MKVLLLNSGGLDSAMVAKWLHSQGVEVWSLHINSRSENAEQLSIAAQETANRYCTNHTEVLLDMGQSSSFIDSNGTLHQLPVASLVTSAVGTTFARLNGILEVYMGIRGPVIEDRANIINEMVNGTSLDYPKPHINLPLRESSSYQTNSQILSVDYSDLQYTHSCPHIVPCGTCPRCIQRASLWTN